MTDRPQAQNPTSGIRLPRRMAWYLNYGLDGKSSRRRRKQLSCNLINAVSASVAGSYALGTIVFDFALWPTSLVALGLGVQFFLMPFWFHRNPSASTLFAVVFSSAGFAAQSVLVGVESGLFLYLMLVPPYLLATLGPAWKGHLVFATLVGLGTMLACVFLIGDAALPAARDPLAQGVLLGSSIAAAVILTLAFGYLAFARAETAEDALEAEYARSEHLLYNLLPEDIAARLKSEPDRTIADSLPNVAILFADIVNFTPRSAKMAPGEIVDFLNRIFTEFDRLATRHGLEKIKTIGDAYMVAAGIPNPCGNPVHRVAGMAQDMLEVTAALPGNVEIRIGLDAGPAVAGVIGDQKLFYDVWGETVNTASRMESHGLPGRIQVTKAAKEALEGDYAFAARGAVDIKGMGQIETWWLVSGAGSDGVASPRQK